MGNENGEWIIRGLAESDPAALRSPEDVIREVGRVGLLPLFAGGGVRGLSVEERTPSAWWWSDTERDPWYWREQIAASGRAVYGKFFGGKAGFVSLDCFPRFANVRRDGYDFDALYEDGKASIRCKKIMDCFALADELPSYELKNLAGFGKGGERNFEGTVAKLQQQAYLVIRAFRRRRNARGLEYGWPVAVYTPAEHLVSPELIAAAYREEPSESAQKLLGILKKAAPGAPESALLQLICGS